MENDGFYQEQLRQLNALTGDYPLDGILRGIEKENLRVHASGHYVTTPQPQGFGSALTHPSITTDFSESLLECVTPPAIGRQQLFASLQEITAWAVHVLKEQAEPEYLWPYSMPYLQNESQADAAPIAYYGTSAIGQMKRVYRRGLVTRYGKAMQLIAGIHYNLSFPSHFLCQLGSLPGFAGEEGQALVSQRYMGLIRNFIRYQWVLAYLMGSSPVCFKGSLQGKAAPAYLNEVDSGVFVGENSGSLRLGDLGYKNSAQSAIRLSFDSIERYAKDLYMATKMPDGHLCSTTVKDAEGHYQQLNRNLLQLENEYYFNIRPKPNPQLTSGLRPAVALYQHGVEYIELRGLDLDCMSPLGIREETSYFCDLFLLYLLVKPSPQLSNVDRMLGSQNLKVAVENGRHADARVVFEDKQQPLTEALQAILDDMQPLAAWMDRAEKAGGQGYTQALEQQRAVASGQALTRSAEFLQLWRESGKPFAEFLLAQQFQQLDYFQQHPLSQQQQQKWRQLALASLEEQQVLEQSNSMDFETYLGNYFSQSLSGEC